MNNSQRLFRVLSILVVTLPPSIPPARRGDGSRWESGRARWLQPLVIWAILALIVFLASIPAYGPRQRSDCASQSFIMASTSRAMPCNRWVSRCGSPSSQVIFLALHRYLLRGLLIGVVED